jgi:predicted transcriptional regulator
MKKASPTTYEVGSIGEFSDWTRRVVRDPSAACGVPQKWFSSEDTTWRAGAGLVSAEAMVELLSSGNLAVLAAIRERKPGSVRKLAALTGRKEASLSRTLKRFAQAGIVGFQNGPGRARVQRLLRAACIWKSI